MANSVAAVLGGATQLQGTVNGYGERTGNANLMTCIPNLELKLGVQCLPEGRLERLTAVSRHVAELVNLPPHAADPYVGQSAFAHKGGLHTSALGKAGGATYEHIEPELVGNGTRVLVSDLGGRAGMSMKAKELGVDLDDRAAGPAHRGPQAARGRGLRVRGGRRQPRAAHAPGRRAGSRPSSRSRATGPPPTTATAAAEAVTIDTEATVKVWVGDERHIAVGEGNGPVNALDQALRNVLRGSYPQVDHIHLTDYRVRILDGVATTGAVVRVLLDSTDGERAWTTIGVSANIIEASWQALTDALVWGLLHADELAFGVVAAPEFVPVDRTKLLRTYESPPRRPAPWLADRPGELLARPARRARLGYPGPDQGYVLRLARQFHGKLALTSGEHERDALAGGCGVALRRASLFGRAPVVHDLTVALTVWGFLGEAAAGARRAAQAAVRGGGAPAPLRRAAPPRRPRRRGHPPHDPAAGGRGPPRRLALPARRPPARSPAGTSDGDRPPPLRAVAHGLPAPRQRPHGAVQLARGSPHRRRDAAAGRGHRPRALPLGARREHPRPRSRWLGLDWDGEIVFQADNLDAHRDAALQLLAAGRAYWCDCTSDAVQARAKERGGPPGYDGFCRDRGLAQSDATALRFRTPDDGTTVVHRPRPRRGLLREHDPRGLRPPAVDRACRCSCSPTPTTTRRWASPTSCAARTTSPARRSTCSSRDALGLGRPEVFAHLPLLVNEGRKKLSKRKDSVSVADFQAEGYLPEAMVNYLALLGWGPKDGVEVRPLSEIVELFRLEDVTSSPAFFDVKKLQSFNADRIRGAAARRVPGPGPPVPHPRRAGGGRARRRWRRSCRSGCACSPRSSR